MQPQTPEPGQRRGELQGTPSMSSTSPSPSRGNYSRVVGSKPKYKPAAESIPPAETIPPISSTNIGDALGGTNTVPPISTTNIGDALGGAGGDRGGDVGGGDNAEGNGDVGNQSRAADDNLNVDDGPQPGQGQIEFNDTAASNETNLNGSNDNQNVNDNQNLGDSTNIDMNSNNLNNDNNSGNSSTRRIGENQQPSSFFNGQSGREMERFSSTGTLNSTGNFNSTGSSGMTNLKSRTPSTNVISSASLKPHSSTATIDTRGFFADHAKGAKNQTRGRTPPRGWRHPGTVKNNIATESGNAETPNPLQYRSTLTRDKSVTGSKGFLERIERLTRPKSSNPNLNKNSNNNSNNNNQTDKRSKSTDPDRPKSPPLKFGIGNFTKDGSNADLMNDQDRSLWNSPRVLEASRIEDMDEILKDEKQHAKALWGKV
jgi:hypothetical protein